MTPTQEKMLNSLYAQALKTLLERHPELRADPKQLDRRALEIAVKAVCAIDPTAGAAPAPTETT